jgi:3-phenylpropionate/trans-cinnamate dioxygenase ferredoxin reductase subunit
MSEEALIVVGAGHAGSECAVQARASGWRGAITLIGDEKPLPYHRPPLSKAYLAGSADAASIALRAAAVYEDAGVNLLLGHKVQAIDRVRACVELDDGTSLPFGRLVIATGGRARQMDWSGGRAGRALNVHHVRTLADIDGLREGFVPGARLVLIGGGYIGLEVASVAAQAGLQVTILEGADRVLARVTAPVVSAFYEQVHRVAGVDVRTGVQVIGAHWDAGGERIVAVRSASGEEFDADMVIVGIGLVPNTELASAAGLEVNDGILVDSSLATSDPRILAIGDCARFHSALYDRSIRLESVGNALEQARSAAALLAGRPSPAPGVPWFWSDQFDLKLKMVGLSQGHDHVVIRGSIDSRSFSAFYLQGRRVLAADTVNRAADFVAAKRLVGEAVVVDDTMLRDERIPLKQL